MPDQGQHNRLFSPAIERFVGSFLLKALGCMTQITHLTQECSASDIIARCFGGTPERLAGCEKRSLKIQPFCLKDCHGVQTAFFRQRVLPSKAPSAKVFCKYRVVKPDQDRLADFQSWGSKVAGWAEHGRDCVIAQAIFKVERRHFFTFHGDKG